MEESFGVFAMVSGVFDGFATGWRGGWADATATTAEARSKDSSKEQNESQESLSLVSGISGGAVARCARVQWVIGSDVELACATPRLSLHRTKSDDAMAGG